MKTHDPLTHWINAITNFATVALSECCFVLRMDDIIMIFQGAFCISVHISQYSKLIRHVSVVFDYRKLELRHKVEIIHQCLVAIAFLHDRKPEAVTHRDIKPGNILVK